MEAFPVDNFFKKWRREWEEGIDGSLRTARQDIGRVFLADRSVSILVGEEEQTLIMQNRQVLDPKKGSTVISPRRSHCHHLTPGFEHHSLDIVESFSFRS